MGAAFAAPGFVSAGSNAAIIQKFGIHQVEEGVAYFCELSL
jgi:hypothetical protein